MNTTTVTEEELRRALAEKLGWKRLCGHDWIAPDDPCLGKYAQELPPLSELVATGEGRLNDGEIAMYARNIDDTLPVDGYPMRSNTNGELQLDWVHIGRLITARASIRAQALIEIL